MTTVSVQLTKEELDYLWDMATDAGAPEQEKYLEALERLRALDNAPIAKYITQYGMYRIDCPKCKQWEACCVDPRDIKDGLCNFLCRKCYHREVLRVVSKYIKES